MLKPAWVLAHKPTTPEQKTPQGSTWSSWFRVQRFKIQDLGPKGLLVSLGVLRLSFWDVLAGTEAQSPRPENPKTPKL